MSSWNAPHKGKAKDKQMCSEEHSLVLLGWNFKKRGKSPRWMEYFEKQDTEGSPANNSHVRKRWEMSKETSVAAQTAF